MKPIISAILFGIQITGFTCALVPAQEYRDSLEKYIEIAAKNNPSVQQKFFEFQAALQKVAQAGSLPDPELGAGVLLKPMELVSGHQIAELNIMQMFPWFGLIRNSKDEMSLMANAKYEALRDAKEQLAYDIQKTWFELFKIRKNISVTQENIELLKTIEQLATARFRSLSASGISPASSGMKIQEEPSMSQAAENRTGMQNMGKSFPPALPQKQMIEQSGSMNAPAGSGLKDLLMIQTEILNLEENISLLKNKEKSLTALINSYLNRHPLSPVVTGETLSRDSLPAYLGNFIDSIIINNPMLTMLESERQSYQAKKKMVLAMGYPMVGLGLNYSVIARNEMSVSDMNGQDMIMPMIKITLPINRGKYKSMQKEAELLELAALKNYQSEYNSLQAEYYRALQDYDDAGRRTSLYEKLSAMTEKTFRLVLNDYSVTQAELSDVLRIQQQALDYELKKTEAVTDLNTAIAYLKRLASTSKIK